MQAVFYVFLKACKKIIRNTNIKKGNDIRFGYH